MSERELELLGRIERLERQTGKSAAIIRASVIVSFTLFIGIVAAGWIGRGGGTGGWSGLWFNGLMAAAALSLFWTAHRS